jgi:YD repeat-containing protein
MTNLLNARHKTLGYRRRNGADHTTSYIAFAHITGGVTWARRDVVRNCARVAAFAGDRSPV